MQTEKQRENKRKYYQKNKEKIKKYNRERSQRPEVKKYRIEYNKEYRKEYSQRPEVKKRIKEYNKEYQQSPKRKEYVKEYSQRPEVKKLIKKYSKSPKRKYQKYKWGAETRNLEWKLTIEQFMTFWQKYCFYCGDEIKTIGIDRIDNEKGYSIDNCVPCCIICNRMKRSLSQKEFINHCKKITKTVKS